MHRNLYYLEKNKMKWIVITKDIKNKKSNERYEMNSDNVLF